MPTPPRPGEKRKDFISRAVADVLADKTAADPRQATAIAHAMWRRSKRVREEYVMPMAELDPTVAVDGDGRVATFDCPMCADQHRVAARVGPDAEADNLGPVGAMCGLRGVVEGGVMHWSEDCSMHGADQDAAMPAGRG